MGAWRVWLLAFGAVAAACASKRAPAPVSPVAAKDTQLSVAPVSPQAAKDTQLSVGAVAPPDGVIANQVGPKVGIGRVQPPRRRKAPMPIYPPLLRRRDIEGDVTVMVTTDPTGKVTDVKLIKGSPHPDFNEAATSAAMHEDFEPARMDGVPTPFSLAFTYRFRIDRPTGRVANVIVRPALPVSGDFVACFTRVASTLIFPTFDGAPITIKQSFTLTPKR